MPEVSIIMPVYNAEAYLKDTIDSVLSQKYQDFELVAVNDGSKDDSLSLLRAYAEKDSRIVVIDKPNTGVSDTRNVALKNAKGRYACFLDSDDLLSPCFLEELMMVATENDADMVVCGYIPFHEHPVFGAGSGKISKALSSADLVHADVLTSACTKLIKISTLYMQNIFFDTHLSFGEDLFFSWKAFLACKNVWLTDRKLYGYRMTAGSAIHRLHSDLYEKYKAAFVDLKQFYEGITDDPIYEEQLMDVFFTKRIPSFCMMIAREQLPIRKKIQKLEIILKDKIICEQLCDFEAFTEGMSEQERKLYRNAKDGRAGLLLLNGYKRDIVIKISGLKGKFRR